VALDPLPGGHQDRGSPLAERTALEPGQGTGDGPGHHLFQGSFFLKMGIGVLGGVPVVLDGHSGHLFRRDAVPFHVSAGQMREGG
jgi:hypothetical protein